MRRYGVVIRRIKVVRKPGHEAPESSRPPAVLILGGGFGGLACARKLNRQPVDVTLVDTRTYHLFTPLLYEVASALLNPSDISYPFRARFSRSPNVRFRQAFATSVDLEQRIVSTRSDGNLGYDYLVLATGSLNNYFGNENVADASLGMKTLEEALRLRNHVLTCLEEAAEASSHEERRQWLTFVVVGGGPTGIEYVGALLELLKLVLGRDFPDLVPDHSRVILVEGRDRLLPAFAPSLSAYAERTLARRGAEVRTSTIMQTATGEDAILAGGEVIRTKTIVWCAGVRPNNEIITDAPRSRSHRITVDEELRMIGRREVFIVGDTASASPEGDELPMLAPVAMQQGRYAARAILRSVKASNEAVQPFRYVDKGLMATIGRNAAVAQIGPFRFTGFVGWLTWLVVHLYYLVGFRNRLVVLASWGWNYVRKDRPIRIVVRALADPIEEPQ